MNIVPVAINENNPTQNAAFICNTIKEKYFFWSIKYSAVNCIRRAWDTFMNKTSDIFNKNSVVIGTNTLQTPNTKEYYKVIHNTFYYIIS